ncbi:hypothetical protein FOCG_10188 [Fusarium oxysporum f. sp. radicis-lycopersici 26381]|uniref:Uncharacterized protein n=3 Tax=Fusarium oxysporum TaxID=5507 RepID=A0A0J9U9P4_FUSO4|nr:hypothetical protein FOXG_17922 [Fusarium oxysporum f. sp. lycopersici 4287]EWZ51220.1 hypothetical protein FOZG_01393 [Fusarium oxysporum Fo47]EWZ91307.1 hypothetical protein FOWG_06936 [Fusarium oxysporum f. sp. lycopersici MN25]EXK48487.1 hypothetical protein FOMG_01397 [Fusarium oxysporum f. sp. melonis 26406]EXL50101.1 hypothetical protein FOCG_10188 [Fusarium oxysporum f. sp. radicis-lycopersici 26381]KNA94810.1 hypothetical protein FOXG_17922 [Fusarium oxysporum f. sp. lycopersici 42
MFYNSAYGALPGVLWLPKTLKVCNCALAWKLASYNLSVAMFGGKPRNSRLRYNGQLENEEMNTED